MSEPTLARLAAPVRWTVKHLRIAAQFARIGLIRKSQFRVEFVNQVVMDVIYYASHILFFEFLYRHTDTIAGWSRAETRVFLGYYFVADSFQMVWLGQAWHFSDDLKKGNLDPVRVRPASPIVLYFFQRFSVEGSLNLAIASGYLAWGLAQQGFAATPASLAAVVWALALAWWGRAVLTFLYSIVEFWITSSGLSKFLEYSIGAFGERPLDVLPRRLRWFFVHAIPVGALAWLPASIALGRVGFGRGLFLSAWLLVIGWAVCAGWKASFRRYESAMG